MKLPRFTLKRLLTVVAIFAIALFIWIQYPTTKAKWCVAAINEGRSDPYQFVDRPTGQGIFQNFDEANTKTATAELLKRSWTDLLHGQRSFAATLTWHADRSKFDRQHTVVIRATPLGYQLYQWQEMSVPSHPKAQPKAE